MAEIAPEMPRQIAKWGGSMAQWLNNVEELRSFIQSRCTIIDQGIVDCYDVTGPFDITINIEPVGSPNEVLVNTLNPLSYPFVGDYFGNTEMTLTAQSAIGWDFDYWTVANHVFAPDQLSEAIQLAIEMDDVITAFFVPGIPGQSYANYTGCEGDNYSVDVNGVTYTEANPTGTEVIPNGAVSGQDSTIFVNLVFNAASSEMVSYTGDEGDGYSVDIDGTTYNEANPTGTEVLVNYLGCDSTVTVNLVFNPVIPGEGNENYTGCEGDNYQVVVNGTIYDEANPTGIEIIVGGASNGLDSTVNVNLIYYPNTTNDVSYIGEEGDGYSVSVDGVTYNEANPTGTEVLSNYWGCDSTVTVNLVFESTGCDAPTNLQSDVNYDNASLTWDAVADAGQYLIRYKRAWETTWNETSQFSPMYNLFGLVACSEYTFEVRALCDNLELSDYTSHIFNTECVTNVEGLPSTIGSLDIYPNPFQNNVVIDVLLLATKNVEIEVFDITGKQVHYTNQGTMPAGKHIINIDEMAAMSSGVYLVRINIGSELLTRELIKMN
ncbi:MAG: hypothetical protein ACI94Y_001295 [Maribacter sp.]